MNLNSHLRLHLLNHLIAQASDFAVVTKVQKLPAGKKGSRNFVNNRCLPCNETNSFYLKRFSVLGRAWKRVSKAANLGRKWNVLGDTSQVPGNCHADSASWRGFQA